MCLVSTNEPSSLPVQFENLEPIYIPPSFTSEYGIMDKFHIPEPFANIIVEINELSQRFSTLEHSDSVEA